LIRGRKVLVARAFPLLPFEILAITAILAILAMGIPSLARMIKNSFWLYPQHLVS
jgi:hypothetical protein